MEPHHPPPTSHTGKVLLAGGIAALLASACCVGPLLLLMLGLSGAWVSQLAALEPYQTYFAAAAAVAVILAGRQIWAPAAACEPGQVCAVPRVRIAYKILFGLVLALLVLALGFPLIAHWLY